MQTYRYGDVRGTDTRCLRDVTVILLGCAYAGFPVALSGLAPETVDRYQRLIDKANAAVGLLEGQTRQLWRNTLPAAADCHDLLDPLAEHLVRLLLDGGDLGADEV